MRSTAFIAVSSLVSLAAANAMPHMVVDFNLYERDGQYGDAPTSTSTKYVYVTLTKTVHTTGIHGPFTTTIYPEPIPTTTPCTTETTLQANHYTTTSTPSAYPTTEATVNTTTPCTTSSWATYTSPRHSHGTHVPTYPGGNATYVSATPVPQPTYPQSSENSAATFGFSKVMGLMGVVAVVAGML